MIDKKQCPAHTRTPWGTSSHRYDYRLRYVAMGLLLLTLLTVIIVCIVFVAGHEALNLDQVIDDDGQDHSYHPAFNPCGDQFNDCQAYYKPNFCCGFGDACYETEWSASGIYCCPSEDDCIVSEDHAPRCLHGTKQCVREVGGGCCPVGTTCSPNGCLRISFEDATSTSETQNGTGAENSEATHTGVKLGETGDLNSAPFTGGPSSSMMGLALAIVCWTMLV